MQHDIDVHAPFVVDQHDAAVVGIVLVAVAVLKSRDAERRRNAALATRVQVRVRLGHKDHQVSWINGVARLKVDARLGVFKELELKAIATVCHVARGNGLREV